MAEFCLECLNKINRRQDPAWKFILGKELELCEGCGKYKHTVVMYRRAYYLRKLRYGSLPLQIIGFPFLLMYRLFTLPHSLYLQGRIKKKATVIMAYLFFLCLLAIMVKLL